MNKKILAIMIAGLLITGCGGSGSDNEGSISAPIPTPTPTPAPAPTPDMDARMSDAARLLSQASYGPNQSSIEQVIQVGNEAWIDWQLTLPASSHVEYIRRFQGDFPNDELRDFRMEAWWQISVKGEDQLRQRVALALSEILVISERSDFFDDTYGIANYYDLLAEHAFGNYRDLLEAVTLSPIMGMYLSMLGNEKPDRFRNIRPDENYAREVMQLFGIGLAELNQDGTYKTDLQGNTIATYDQSIIEGFAHVYTGWNFSGTTAETWWNWYDNYDSQNPMVAVQEFHDGGTKKLLGDLVLPAGQSAEEDLDQALDNIFSHPNVAPFVSAQLIGKLVTSNPSKEYVGRVAGTFNDNGQQIRGDMGAVVKAILMDPEARNGHELAPGFFGKLREPILKATHLWRAFDAVSLNNRLQLAYPSYFFNQAPLSSPSVFNFFSPSFAPPGIIADAGMVAPEFQIVGENFVIRTSNFIAYSALYSHDPEGLEKEEDIAIDLTDEVLLVNDPESLVQRLNILLMSGSMSEQMKTILIEALAQNEIDDDDQKVANLIFLVMNSPQYAVQK